MHGSEHEEFVAKFTDFWRDPSAERMAEILHPDVVLLQPLAAPMHGIEAARAEFRGIWRMLPDLHARIDRWRGDSDVLFIEFRLRARVGRSLLEWPNIDRFVLRDGKAVLRTNYFDPLPVLGKVLVHPSLWWRWWTSGVARPWRTGHGIPDYTDSLPRETH
ncbi:nuclear transport factor 2 family protein [Nocardia otitidiscaviarum]|nr:nuclear transport factor 2 family protein [Nocardia otitidiscaviarum]MCP9622738.1 nuclear transport factor 2 family protein [Nocardia otitidiscaviarum]